MFKTPLSYSALALLFCTAPPQLNADVSLQEYDDLSSDDFHCVEPDVPNEPLCDASNNEASPAFTSSPIMAGAIQLDIRPEDCTSFFDDYLHTRRGLRIETALELALEYQHYQSTVTNFPIVDFISTGDLRVVKTRDLTANSFQATGNSETLYKQIINDAADIQDRFLSVLDNQGTISATANGATTNISRSDVGNITLDIIIQSGIASLQHATQIKRAKQHVKQKWGFDLRIIEIP